jgi:hypothetical protein
MSFIRLASVTLASSLLLAGLAITAPAELAAAQESQAKMETASGTLTKVDADKKTLSVKASDGAETTFTYTSSTVISGDQKSEQGLATAEGSMVTVTYSVKDGSKIASKVEVQPKAKE